MLTNDAGLVFVSPGCNGYFTVVNGNICATVLYSNGIMFTQLYRAQVIY